MKTFEFKQLNIKPEGNWIKRTFATPHAKRTLFYALFGALMGYVIYFFSDIRPDGVLWSESTLQNILMGLGFGIFITNSPCARGKC